MIQLHYYTDQTFISRTVHDFITVEEIPMVAEGGGVMPLSLPSISLPRYKVTINVEVDDSSYRYRALMRKPQLVLKFSLPEYIDFPVGTWCVYQNETYRLNSEKNLKKNGKRNITYDMTLGGDEDKLGLYKFRNSVDGRLKFSMCAKPHELVEEVVKNLNAREGANVWSVGEPIIESTEKTVEFNHCYIDAALQSIADTFETEWEIVDRVVYLRKVEYNKDNPLPLSYGRGNGFVPGLGRTTDLDEAPIKRIYTQGGTRNIDRGKYGGDGSQFPEYATSSAELLLPPSQTLEYEGRTYKTDAQGYYVERIDAVSKAVKEDSLDCSEIYPSHVGTVGTVTAVNPAKHFYDFVDPLIPEELNYNNCLIKGVTPTIIFQSGMLAGKEFEFKYRHDEKRFEIVPQEIDGIIMPDPDSGYMPETGNEYVVLGIMLPKQYFFDNTTKTGASWDMFREAAKKLYEREDAKFTFKGDLQGLWAKRNWLNIGGKLVVGGYILFTDDQFAVDGVKIRITGIKDYVNAPYAPTLEISNSVSGSTVRSELAKIENTEVVIGDKTDSLLQFTKRRFRDAKETIEMLEDAMLDNFNNSISPVAVQTMAALIGDQSLQYRFVSSKSNLEQVVFPITYNQDTKKLHCPHGYLQHMTIGITSLSSTHADNEYKCWEVGEFNSPVLDEAEQKYYLYAIVSKDNTDEVGQFALSTNSLPFIGSGSLGDISLNGKYCLLVGVLNSEYDGERSFVPLYGFTEVLPGRITTDRIVSGDGKSYFDMTANALKLGNKLSFNTQGDGLLRLRGTLIQNDGDDESFIGCFRGVWNAAYFYYNGDEVTYTANGLTSTYRYVYATPSKGVEPTNTTYWQILAEGQKGDKGDKGEDGKSPVLVFRGDYNPNTEYIGNEYRVDAVRATVNGDTTFFLAQIGAGTFKGIAPPDANKWHPFGATFDSVATNLLLAENANIGDWFMSGGKIVSTLSSEDVIELDAKNNRIYIKSATSGGDFAAETGLGSKIELNAATGIIEARSNDPDSALSYMSPSGIFANRAGTRCVASSLGYDQRAAIVGVGNGNLSKDYDDDNRLGSETNIIAGVYGTSSNDGTATHYGGYFTNLKACGLVLNTKYVGKSPKYELLSDTDSLVIGYDDDNPTDVYLPAATREGQTIFVKHYGRGFLRFYTQGEQLIYDDSTENAYYDFGNGWGGVFHFTKAFINNTLTHIWLVSRYKF